MSNTYKSIIAVITVAIIAAGAGIYLNTQPKNVNIQSSITTTSSTQVVSSVSSVIKSITLPIKSSDQTASSSIEEELVIQDRLKITTITGNIGDKPFSLNILNDTEAEYIYDRISEKRIPLKILKFTNDEILLSENSSTNFTLNLKNYIGSWASSRNAYEIKFQISPRLDLVEYLVVNNKNPESITLECTSETKYKIGNCKILDKDLKVVGNFAKSGYYILRDPINNSQKIITFFSGYNSCTYQEYTFNLINNTLTQDKDIVGDCKYPDLQKAIDEYKWN